MVIFGVYRYGASFVSFVLVCSFLGGGKQFSEGVQLDPRCARTGVKSNTLSVSSFPTVEIRIRFRPMFCVSTTCYNVLVSRTPYPHGFISYLI